MRAFSSCGGRGLRLAAVCGSLTAVPSLFAGRGLQAAGSVVAAPGLQGAGAVVVKHGLHAPRHVGLPGPGVEPVSPALAGGFLTTGPPGKPPGRRRLRLNLLGERRWDL